MNNYELKELAERICEHKPGKTVCICPRKPLSAAVAAYLERKRKSGMYPDAIHYNAEWTPDGQPHERFRPLDYAAGRSNRPGLRYVGAVHEICMGTGTGDNRPYIDRGLIDHTGWYTDPHRDAFKDGTGLCFGVVYQLPTRKGGTWQYVPGYQTGGFEPDSPVLDFRAICSDIRAAVHIADRMAEAAAEAEREYQAKSQAEDRIGDIDSEVAEIRTSLHGLFGEIKANRDNVGGAPHLREAVCTQIRKRRNRVKKLIREKLSLQADFWNALPEEYRS